MLNNKKNIFKILVVVVFILFLSFLIIDNHPESISEQKGIKFIEIAGKTIKVEIADTSILQEKGLSGRKVLQEDEGMLFVFENLGKYSFWMKEMNFPIDIIWIGENFKIIYIKKSALPKSYPETFSPNENAKYVLEVLAGFSEKNNLQVGDSVKFLP